MKNQFKIGLLSACFLAGPAAAAPVAAPAVYSGCSAPPTTYTNTWVIDAVNGDDVAGAGTAAKPWKTVQSLFSQGVWGGPRYSVYPYWHGETVAGVRRFLWGPNASGPVGPGDAVELKDGHYGAIRIGVFNLNINNPGWLTIFAAPGAAATLPAISIAYPMNKLRFSGLTVRGDGLAGGALVADMAGSDVMIDGLDIAHVDDVDRKGFTAAQWNANVTRTGIVVGPVSCVTVAGDMIHNVMVGVGLASSRQAVVADNEIHHFIMDGIDVGGDNIAVLRNRIHDPIAVSGNHMDAVQGFGGPGPGSSGHFANLVIDSNVITRQLDPENAFALTVQGINAFNSDWTNVLVSRNVVSTSACWGISWGSSHGALFANNTIVWDGAMSGVSNEAGGIKCDPTFAPFTPTHEYPVGDHIVAVNNLVVSMAKASSPIGSVAAGNVVTGQGGNTLQAASGGVFAQARPATSVGLFDARLAIGSPAVGVGVASIPAPGDLSAYPGLKLPTSDIMGLPFSTTAPSVGAYAFQGKPFPP